MLSMADLVSLEELQDDAEYKDILADIRQECSSYGTVVNVVIPRPQGSTPVAGLGKVFVEFQTEQDAAKAKSMLEGRKFGPKVVVPQFFPEDAFAQQQFY